MPRRAVILGLGFAMTYVALAFLLPAPAIAPAIVPAVAPAVEASGCTAACGSEAPGHDCGLDAKAMLGRFQAAIEEKGPVHETYTFRSGDVDAACISGRVNLGLEAAAFAGLEPLAARHGLVVVRSLPSLGLALLRQPTGAAVAPALLAALAAEPGVRFAEPDVVARVALTPNDPFFAIQDGARDAQVDSAWDLTTGSPSVLVAVLDTGADTTHEDLRNRLVPGWDVIGNSAAVRDDNGHGTAMCGIIAAEGRNGVGIAGVAFDARILPIKVADAMGVASVADVAAGISLAVQRGARVINLSMGARVGSQTLETAVQQAIAAGVVVVAAAGNDPVHHEMAPASYPGVLSCTVLGARGELGFEAVVCEGVDLGCPAEQVVTTMPGGVYGFVGGSSAAAAYASGVAALVASRDPTLTGAQIGQVLRSSQDPVAALAGLESILRFGRLNARRAVERARANLVDVAVTGLRVLPQTPLPGQASRAVVEVENRGCVAVSGLPLRVTLDGIEIGVVGANLAPGQRSEVSFALTAPAAGVHGIVSTLNSPIGEATPMDNERRMPFTTRAQGEADLVVIGRSISSPDLARGGVTLTVTVENRGTAAVTNASVAGRVDEVVSTSLPGARPARAWTLGTQTASLAVGARATLSFTWTIPTPAPTGILRFLGDVASAPGEVDRTDNTVYLAFALGAQGPLQPLYQQSNGVDIIPDAPFRVDPARPYVPVSIFVPSKGGRTAATSLRVTRTEVILRDTPQGPGTSLYDDPSGAPPTVVPAGLELVDELGVVRNGANAKDMFNGVDLDANGRHDILRLPRAALGVASTPAAPVDKYLDVKVSWDERQVLFYFWSTTRSGSHRSVLKVRFAPTPFPAIPGDNHYHDVHHHTIAEWFFGSPIDLFAPRKAYGGPLQMVFETAYAMGVISAPTQQAAWGKIISSDHNCFNNRTIPDPDGPDHRPPFGPQSVSARPVPQLDAFRQILGPSAGEEIAFKQDVPVPHLPIPLVNSILNVLPGLPLGAHMLLYHSDHVEGAWHGGGWLMGPGNPNINVMLFDLLGDVAKNRQSQQERAFAYAAHPFSGQGWRDENLERGFGLDPTKRTREAVHDTTNEFVLKGVEFYNGRGTRTLPNNLIDFNDLNPWADPTFARGVSNWDKSLWAHMTEWHEFISKTLDYSFVSDPEVKFIRKVYQAGGSDAHGDFNFATGRTATPLSVQATYSVGDETWYGVRTYCLGDGKAGATPEDRWMAAYSDGNTVTTDGPLFTFSLDADRSFDSSNLRWHDKLSRVEDADGRMGGDGPLDGGYTALVKRGSAAPGFRYRYTSTPEWGPVAAALLYKTEAGAKNPTQQKGGVDRIVGVNRFALAGADQDLEQPLDLSKEGPVTKLTAYAAGAFTGADPDQRDLGPDDFRCYTNPIYAVPYDVTTSVTAVDAAKAVIPAGALEVTFTFDVSMSPSNPSVEVKALDANGESTGKADLPLSLMIPKAGSPTGWSDRPGIRSSVLTLVNKDPIPLSGAEYPAAGKSSFVVYWRQGPRDAAGNVLNSIATTFESSHHAAPPGGSASTASPATAGNATGGGGHGGGGCALGAAPSPAAPGALALVGLLALGLVVTRRRALA